MRNKKISKEIESLAALDRGMDLVVQILAKMNQAVLAMEELEKKEWGASDNDG